MLHKDLLWDVVALTEAVGVLCRDHRLLLDMPTQGRLGEATGSILPARTRRAGMFPLFCKKHPWLTVTASLSIARQMLVLVKVPQSQGRQVWWSSRAGDRVGI